MSTPEGVIRVRSWVVAVVAIAVAVVAVSAAVIVVAVKGGGPAPVAASVTLEPAASAGADPFTASVARGPVEVAGAARAKSAAFRRTLPADRITHTLVVTGTAPGLYGGSGNVHVCDPQQLVTFLAQHPDKAAAWAKVLGIAPANIAGYVATLTPVLLTGDTLVGNHGYRGGVATFHLSVLQAGTAVMVDATGTPRVKCNCGNPLTPPQLITLSKANTRGVAWPGYTPAAVTAVRPGTATGTLRVVNITTGSIYDQPVATPATGSGPTERCTTLDPDLETRLPGTPALEKAASEALTDGCVAYVATSSSPSMLDLEFIRGPLAGTAISIGPVTSTTGGVTLTDLALTAAGTLYGVDFGSELYTIDPNTARATRVGSVNSVVNGLVIGPTGTIYASGGSQLFTIDPTSGAGRNVGATGYSSSGDLAFAYGGTLYMTASAGGSGDSLASVNPITGRATIVGAIGQGGVWGLVSSYGTLFAQTSGGLLLTVDPSTGAGTVIATQGPSANGMAALPPTAATSTDTSPSPTTPTSARTSTSASPPGSSGSPAAANVGATFAGTWRAHEMSLVIDKAGTGHLSYADLTLCPSCSFGNAPRGTLVFVLTSVAHAVATGHVTVTSDPKNWTVGAPVHVRLTAGSPGQLLGVDIGGKTLLSFCNSTSVGQCGA